MHRKTLLLAIPWLMLLAWFLVPRSASAHAVGISRGEYHVTGDEVRARLVFAGPELATALPALDTDGNGALSPAEVERGGAVFDRAIVHATRIAASGAPCTAHFDSASITGGDAVAIAATFVCDRDARALAIDCDFLDAFSADHRHLAEVEIAGVARPFLVVSAQKHIEPSVAPAGTATFARMVGIGVEHILTGYDHLAFLLGLLLLGGRARTLLGIVTAFTVAHSITLCLAALHILTLSPRVVEPAIALSIAYVGVENFFVKDASKRWRITFPFGLLHGFGFAGALVALDLPRAELPRALFAFNLGVELGQVGVLALVLPIITIARKNEAFRVWGVRALSATIAVAGLVWFGARVLDRDVTSRASHGSRHPTSIRTTA